MTENTQSIKPTLPRGLFVVFEGCDKCGKSTQMELTYKYYSKFYEDYYKNSPSFRSELANPVKMVFPNRTTETGKVIDKYLTSDDDQSTLAEPYRIRVKESEAKIVQLSEENIVHCARVERARRDLISTQIQALLDAERTGTISSVVANEVLHKLDKALGESEFKQEEILESSRSEQPVEDVVDDEMSESLIPESTENVVGSATDSSEE